MIQYKTASTKQELEQILRLQKKNLPASLSSKEKQNEGFVTVHHDFDLLKRMNEVCPHIIAKQGSQVVGYALCMHPKFEDEIEVLKSMFSEITKALKPKSTYIVMGQVCIDKDYRRLGVFRQLYNKMKEVTSREFDAIVTEVDATNTRSLQAHYAIGFRTLLKYQGDGRNWELIYLK